jgi:hypothetical protein
MVRTTVEEGVIDEVFLHEDTGGARPGRTRVVSRALRGENRRFSASLVRRGSRTMKEARKAIGREGL